MTKKLVLDTNVLLYDLNCLETFKENEVIIPTIVIDELDVFKEEQSENGYASRRMSSKLVDLVNGHGHLIVSEGIPLNQEGGKLFIEDLSAYSIGKNKADNPDKYQYFSSLTVDEKIIECARVNKATLITRDKNMFLKAIAADVNVEMYYADSIAKSVEQYKGYIHLVVEDDVFDMFHKVKQYTMEQVEAMFDVKLYPNEFVIFVKESFRKSTLIGYCQHGNVRYIDLDKELKQLYNGMEFRGQDLEQKMFVYLLNDPNITALTVKGNSGKGKSLLTIDYALNAVKKGNFDEMVYAKSLIETDPTEKLGALPGGVMEKMAPSLQPLYSCLEKIHKEARSSQEIGSKTSKNGKPTKDRSNIKIEEILGLDLLSNMGAKKAIDLMLEGVLSIQPLTYLRGMTIDNKIVVLDEGQNVKIHTMKTLVTRITDESKLVITGDDEQIDDKNLNKYNNGMTHMIERFKESDNVGHITLDITKKSQRGKLSEMGSTLL